MRLDGAVLAVTGAGGFIGRRMIERARERGLRVRGLERAPEAAAHAGRTGAEVIAGDVTDPDAARRLCEGAQLVFHTAAILDEGGDLEAMRRVNVGGTRTIAEAARAAGATRFVHLSSVMVYGFRFPRLIAEDGPLRGEGNPYCQTKIEGEALLESLHGRGLDVTIIRPGDVYGTGSVPWVLRPLDMMRRRLFVMPGGGRGTMNHVWIDNLLDAVLLAVEKDATGEAFNVTDGAETTFATYFGHLGRMVGRRRLPSFSAPVCRAAFAAIERGATLLRRTPPVRPQAVDFLSRPHPYSIEKARARLGYAPRVSLDEGMAVIARAYAAGELFR